MVDAVEVQQLGERQVDLCHVAHIGRILQAPKPNDSLAVESLLVVVG